MIIQCMILYYAIKSEFYFLWNNMMSILCCNSILNDTLTMAMSCLINHRLIMLSKNDEVLDLLACCLSCNTIQCKQKNLNRLKNYLIILDFKNWFLDYNQCGISRYSSILSFRKTLRRAFA